MNNKEIEKINKKIELAKEYAEYLKVKHKECYDICGIFDVFIPDEREMEYKIKDLEYYKEVLTLLNEKKIEISKKYFIMNNIYLEVFFHGSDLTFYFYMDNDSWFYDNYISSHSGINEWVYKMINDAYDLYSGNSEFNHAFGCFSLNDCRNVIENKKEHYYNNRKYSAQKVADSIELLVKFFTDKKNGTRNAIVKDLNYRFSQMKKLIKEED